MRESLCTAINEEPDLCLVKVITDKEKFSLRITTQHDVYFLAHKPDIVLLALGNPGTADLKAIHYLHQELKDVPILALTRDEVPGQERAALEYGADAVVTKSISRYDLLRTLRSLGRDRSGLDCSDIQQPQTATKLQHGEDVLNTTNR